MLMKQSLFVALGSLFLLAGCTTSGGPLKSRKSSSDIDFQLPVSRPKISQPFRYGNRKKHNGLDLHGKKNTPILASAPGRVIYVGSGFTGFGKLVIVEHGNSPWATFYAHLNKFKVREGDFIDQGQTIGLMGRTGRATGVHLHFEVRYERNPIDPLKVLPPPGLSNKNQLSQSQTTTSNPIKVQPL